MLKKYAIAYHEILMTQRASIIPPRMDAPDFIRPVRMHNQTRTVNTDDLYMFTRLLLLKTVVSLVNYIYCSSDFSLPLMIQ